MTGLLLIPSEESGMLSRGNKGHCEPLRSPLAQTVCPTLSSKYAPWLSHSLAPPGVERTGGGLPSHPLSFQVHSPRAPPLAQLLFLKGEWPAASSYRESWFNSGQAAHPLLALRPAAQRSCTSRPFTGNPKLSVGRGEEWPVLLVAPRDVSQRGMSSLLPSS